VWSAKKLKYKINTQFFNNNGYYFFIPGIIKSILLYDLFLGVVKLQRRLTAKALNTVDEMEN